MLSTRNISLLYWFNFFTDFRLYAPIAIIYFSKVTGSYSLGMTVFSAATIAAALFEVPTGIFSDFIGRKMTVTLGAIAAFTSVSFYALGGSLFILIIGAVFEGISRSFYSGNNDALLYDSLKDEGKEDQFAGYLGKTSSLFQLALGISAVLGSLIAQFSFNLVFWMSAIAQFVCIFISLFFIEPKNHLPESTNVYSHLFEAVKLFKNNLRLRWVSLASILSFGIGESMWLFRNAFINLFLPVWSLGFIQAFANIGATASFYFSGKVIKKIGEFRVLLISTIYGRILDFITFIFPSAPTILFGTSGSLFFGVSVTAQGNLLQKEFTNHQRATLGSLNSFGGSIFFGIFSVLLGFAADKIGPINALIISNFLLIIPGFIYWNLLRERKL